jgi:enoyl-CoA hydratase
MVHRETIGAVALLTMDGPPVNALNTGMYNALIERIAELEHDTSVRVVVMRAASSIRVFSAGGDIKEFERFFTPGEGYKICKLTHEINNRLEALAQITIAAMEGPALGGGAELALAFDLRVATPLVRFGFPEIQVGQVPGTGGTLRLPWLIGESAARGILLTGDPITADRAYQLGLFHLLVQPGQAVDSAVSWAAQLAQRPAQSVLAIKRSVLQNRDRDVEKGTERDSQLSEWVFQSDDAKEGHYAFLEKRQPHYTHKIAPMQEVPHP